MKKNRKKEALLPKHREIADFYNETLSVSEVARKVSMSWRTVNKILKSLPVQEYFNKQQMRWDEMSAVMHDKMMTKINEQIEKGVVVEKKIFKKGELLSKIITRTPFSMKELMDLSRLSGRYNPTLKIDQIQNETDEDKNYEEVLEHLESLEKLEKKEKRESKKIH